MTRRCSVMRMPVAAQRASIPVAFNSGVGFNAVMFSGPAERNCFATMRSLRQVASHQKRIQLFPAGLLVIAFTAADHRISRPLVEPSRGLIVFFDFKKAGARAVADQVPEMRQQQVMR